MSYFDYSKVEKNEGLQLIGVNNAYPPQPHRETPVILIKWLWNHYSLATP